MRCVVAADVGATNLRIGIYTKEGELLKSHIMRTPTEGGSDTISETIFDISIKLLKELGLNRSDVLGIGIGTIGPLNLKRGEVVNTPNLKLRSFRLREPLIELFNNVNVFVVNDCVAGVWGEKTFGHGVNYYNIAYVTISTGIGCGVIVDNNLLLGKDGNAHEVGHLVVNYSNGLRCNCGGIGHWEAYASGKGIPKFVQYYTQKIKEEKEKHKELFELLESELLTTEKFFELVRMGDEIAVEVCREICKINAAGLASIINVYDPELITIGGAIALANYDLIIEPAVRLIQLYSINRIPEIKLTKLGKEVVLKGAASLVIKPPKILLEIYGLKPSDVTP
ncbi:MAG: ROK family protein [Sulfolobales archaeon]